MADAISEAQLVRAYQELQTDVSRLLGVAKKKGLSTEFLRAQLTQTNKAVAAAEAAEAAFIGTAMPAEYATSAASAQHTLAQGGAEILSERFTGLDRGAVRALQTGVSDRLGSMRRSLTLGLGLGDPRLAQKALRATLDGDNPLVRLVGDQLKVMTPSGRFWDPDAYTKMLSRTAIADSRRVAFGQRYKQNGIDVVKVVGNGSNHATCIFWEGQSLSLTGKTPGLPTVAEARAGGLFHPNCRHRYVMDRDAEQDPTPIGDAPQEPQTPPPTKAPKPKPAPKPRAPRKPRVPRKRAAQVLSPVDEIDWKNDFDPGVKSDLKKLPSAGSRSDLSSLQKDTVSRYSGSGYIEMNKGLRKKSKLRGPVQKAVDGLDGAIDKSFLSKERILYRGTGGKNPARFGNYEIGAEFSDAGFQSWTADRSISTNFALKSAETRQQATAFRVRVPKGSKGLFVDEIESEFILPRGSKYRIVDVEETVKVASRAKGTESVTMRVVTLEIVP